MIEMGHHNKGMLVREDTYPESSAYEVGRPGIFLATFISIVLPPGSSICCWVNSERAFSQGIESDSNRTIDSRVNLLKNAYFRTEQP